MSDPVRILVVGLGNMGASHASAYHRNDGFEIVGLCSRTIKSKTIPDELQGYPLFEDYESALAELKPDAVSIIMTLFAFRFTMYRVAPSAEVVTPEEYSVPLSEEPEPLKTRVLT